MGCVEGADPAGKSTSTPSAAPAPAKGGSGREVEAPDVFQVSDSALWDGRPSLGGIWVASPDVVDPQRVVMVNPANGKSVNGALFRRERDNPGPPLQVSSDAADALGMLAGQPTELRVTALRRKDAEAPAAAAAAADATASEVAAADPATLAEAGAGTEVGAGTGAEAAETAALAAAALEATATAPGTVAAVVDPAAAAVAGADVPETAKRKTWKERRAEAKAKREAEKAALAAAATDAAGAEDAAVADPAAIAESAAVAATVESAGVAAVETAPLDARTPEVAAAAEAVSEAEPAPEPKKKTRRQIREEQKAAEAAAAEAAAAEPASQAPAGRTIQVASFSKEENANRAVEALAKVGVTAQTQKSERNGKIVWGVVTTGDAAALASIKDAGFADAFFLE